MQIDLSPLITDAVQVAGIVFISVGTWGAGRLAQRFGIQLTASRAQLLHDLLSRAANAGAVAAQNIAQTKGWDHPDVHDAALGQALQFVAAHGDAELKAAGLDPKNAIDAARIQERINALLPTAIAPVAASPATTNGPVAAAAPAAPVPA